MNIILIYNLILIYLNHYYIFIISNNDLDKMSYTENLFITKTYQCTINTINTTREVVKYALSDFPEGDYSLISYSCININSGKAMHIQSLYYNNSDKHVTIVYDTTHTSGSYTITIIFYFMKYTPISQTYPILYPL